MPGPTLRYNGQLFQATTTSFAVSTPDGFAFRFSTWEDLKLEMGSEKELVNNTDGQIAGFTSKPVKTSGGFKIRLEEWFGFLDKTSVAIPDVVAKNSSVLQVQFNGTVSYGNSIANLRKDTCVFLFQKTNRDIGKDGALMVDLPLLVLDFRENVQPGTQGTAPYIYPV